MNQQITQRGGKFFLLLLGVVCVFAYPLKAQKEVSPSLMQQIYDEVKTPYKYGLVIAPENSSKK